MKNKLVCQVVIPKEASSDYADHQKEELINKVILSLKDEFLEGDGIWVSLKVTEDKWPVDDYSMPGLVFTPYNAGTRITAIAHVSKAERVCAYEDINYDYRYAKLGDILKHKISAWLKGRK